MILESALKLAIPVATMLDRENDRKYKEKVLKLEKEIYEEENSPNPDDLKLHNLQFELCKLFELFGAEIGRQKAQDK